jgi:hypothetical protein
LEHERFDLFRTHTEHRSDFLLGMISELKEHQRGALVGGQPPQVLEQFA